MTDINVTFFDYHKFNKNVINNFEITDNNYNDIDWNDFEKTISKVTDLYNSNIYLRIYSNFALKRKVIEMLNDNNVTIVINFYNTYNNDFVYNFFFKYAVADKLLSNIYINDYENYNRSLSNLFDYYNCLHPYDMGSTLTFIPKINEIFVDDIVAIIDQSFTNRYIKVNIPHTNSVFRDIIKYNNELYIPHNLLLEDNGMIITNKQFINNNTIIGRLDEVTKENTILKIKNAVFNIENFITTIYGCKNCIGYDLCPIMKNVLVSSKEDCKENNSYFYTKFIELINKLGFPFNKKYVSVQQ